MHIFYSAVTDPKQIPMTLNLSLVFFGTDLPIRNLHREYQPAKMNVVACLRNIINGKYAISNPAGGTVSVESAVRHPNPLNFIFQREDCILFFDEIFPNFQFVS